MIEIVIEIVLAILSLLAPGGDPIATWVTPAPSTEPAYQIATVAPAPIEECYGITVLVNWDDPNSPMTADRIMHGPTDEGEIRTDIVGTFLWVKFDAIGHNNDDMDKDFQTIPLEQGVESVQICR